MDFDGAGKVRSGSALRGHFEDPSHAGSDGDEVEEIHTASRREHLHQTTVGADGSVVLDDEVPADRLDVDHAAALLISEHTCAPMPLGARLVVRVRETEEPRFEVDVIAGLVQCHVGGVDDGHDQMNPGVE